MQHRRWEEDTLAFLRNVSKLVSTALVRKKDEEAVIRMAYHDQLTGLANGYRFDHYLGQAIEDARADGRYGYVLFIDMDDFKIINDTLGHGVGDELLVKVLMAFGRSSGEALAVIDRQRAELYRVAQAHRRSRSRAARAAQPGDGAADPNHSLALMAADLMGEAIAARHEADLRWLDHCEEAIVSNPERRKP